MGWQTPGGGLAMLSLAEAQRADKIKQTFSSFTSPGLAGVGSVLSHLLPLIQQILQRNETFLPKSLSAPGLSFTQSKTFNADDHPPRSYRIPEYPGPTIPAAPVTALQPLLHSLRGTCSEHLRETLLRASTLHVRKRRKRASPAKDTINAHSRSDVACLVAAAHSSPPRCGRTVPLTPPAPSPYQAV